MLFFRSEAKLTEWLAVRQAKPGAQLSIQRLWELSRRWYHNRMSPEYHGRTLDQVQELFHESGLTSAFWRAD